MRVKALWILVVLSCASCARQDEVDLLKAKIVSLELANAELRDRLESEARAREGVESRLNVAEANLTTLFEKGSSRQSAGEWVLWESQVRGPIGGGFRKPIPKFAYESQAECMDTITYNMRKLGGDEGTGQWTDAAGYTFRGSCLPKGVDPR